MKASSRVSNRMLWRPAKSTPSAPKMTMSVSEMSNACSVSPMTCRISHSHASPSRYLMARSLGSMLSAMKTLTLFRASAWPL